MTVIAGILKSNGNNNNNKTQNNNTNSKEKTNSNDSCSDIFITKGVIATS